MSQVLRVQLLYMGPHLLPFSIAKSFGFSTRQQIGEVKGKEIQSTQFYVLPGERFAGRTEGIEKDIKNTFVHSFFCRF